MELPDQKTAGAADAGDGDPIKTSTEPAEAVDGIVPVDNTEAESEGQDAAILEGIDIDALLANMDNELPLDEDEVRRIIEGDLEVNLEENNVTEATMERNGDLGDTGMEHIAQGVDEDEVRRIIEGGEGVNLEENNVTEATLERNSDIGDVGMEYTAQEMDEDDEYDELFDDDAPDKPPTAPPSSTPLVPQVEPPAPQATPPPQAPPPQATPLPQTAPPTSIPEFDLSTLDLPTVMSNITTLKSAIIANHLLLTRFLHLQSAYRTLSTTLTKERHLLTQAQSAMARMREEADSTSHHSPLLHFQIKQLKDEVLKERAARAQYEATIVQYQENIQAMRAEIEKVRKEKAKLELGEKRAQETLKEGDALRGKVVGLMSENKSLTKRVEELGEQEVVRQNKALEEEIVKLRERVVQLEGNNIRLKAGRSILAGGDGNTAADIQPLAVVQTSATRTFSTIAGALSTPPQQIQASTTVDISDDEATNQTNDEVVFVGANSISATLENFQIASPSTEQHPPPRLPQLQQQPSQQQQRPLLPPPLPLQQPQPAQTQPSPPPPHVSSSQNIGASTASTTEIPPSAGSGLTMREPSAPSSPPPPPVASTAKCTTESTIAPGVEHPQPPASPTKT